MPMRLGSMAHGLALDRTVRMARCASSSGTKGRPLGSRYSSTIPVTPCRGEPLRDAVSLGAGHQAAIPAARADHDGRPIGRVGGRSMHGDGGVSRLELAVTDGSLAGPERVLFGLRQRCLEPDDGSASCSQINNAASVIANSTGRRERAKWDTCLLQILDVLYPQDALYSPPFLLRIGPCLEPTQLPTDMSANEAPRPNVIEPLMGLAADLPRRCQKSVPGTGSKIDGVVAGHQVGRRTPRVVEQVQIVDRCGQQMPHLQRLERQTAKGASPQLGRFLLLTSATTVPEKPQRTQTQRHEKLRMALASQKRTIQTGIADSTCITIKVAVSLSTGTPCSRCGIGRRIVGLETPARP